ncbi:MAG: 30S ribosomal protein S9, partial [Candidatus Omnitrophica bacterium]|nr:30S ribosomal protein S9 [Candidatus Omnitrophota bacterium]
MTEAIVKYITVGRRKESIARVRMSPGKGDIVVNEMPCDKYFLRETDRIMAKQSLQLADSLTKYDIVANIRGGGLT